MTTVRVECSGEYASTWVDINARWTRAQVEQWDAAQDEQSIIAVIGPMVAACNIEQVDGSFVTDPAAVTWAYLREHVDEFILTWLAQAPLWVIAERRILGKASPRASSASKEAMRAAMTRMIPTPQTQPTP